MTGIAPVLVLGATGKTGRLVAAGLRARGVAVREASRAAPGAHRFDWADAGTWRAALDGAGAAYLVTPADPAFPAERVTGFVAEAERAGVRRLALLSGLSAGYGSAPLLSREEPVRASGAAWTILRPGAFQQNVAAGPFLRAVREGTLRQPIGAWPGPASAYIDVADIADVAVTVLTSDGHAGRVYDLAGPRAHTLPDVFALIAAETGLRVSVIDEPEDRWAARAHAAGVPEDRVRWSLETFAALRCGAYATLHDGVRRVLGREPRDLAAFVKAAARAGTWRG